MQNYNLAFYLGAALNLLPENTFACAGFFFVKTMEPHQ
jgi:hypothetical protein